MSFVVKNFVGGELREAVREERLDFYEPATGAVLGTVPRSRAEDVDRAVTAAQEASAGWRSLEAGARAAYLRKLAQLVRENAGGLAELESRNNGKPLRLAQAIDIPRSAQNLEFFADAATQFATECHPGPQMLHYTLRQPLGVVGVISPWNLPLYLLTWKIAPALAAGCTVVAKPSEVTPLTAHRLAELVLQAGLPRGVLNFVHGLGPEAGAALVEHEGVRAVSFTGSTRAGREIAIACAPRFKKHSLEMGGKNATVIFADADFDSAVEGAARAAFQNQGQLCLCGSRILVEASIYDRFKAALVDRAKKLRIADPMDESIEPAFHQGAITSRAQLDKIAAAVERAQGEGGHILVGGKPARLGGRCVEGWFYEPTLIEGLSASCDTNQQEIFGPVSTLIPFVSEKEAIDLANSTDYGLAASVWTRDGARGHRVAAQIEAGLVWVNTWLVRDLRVPFGGSKDSGVGREGGWEAMRFFTEPKSVGVSVPGGIV